MRRLEPDEEVLLAARPHPAMLARPLGCALIVLAACGAGFFGWGSAPAWFGLLLGVVVVLQCLIVAGRLLQWRSSLLAVTSLRVVHRAGLLRRAGREVAVGRVEDVSYLQGLTGRMLGYGSLTVESAGAADPAPFFYVRHPEQVQHEVHLAAERARNARPSPSPTPSVGEGLTDQIERLDALWRRGILSEAEFSAKKAELLERL